ncbi:UbiA family prenyltransferase [Amycolatopsis japonica]
MATRLFAHAQTWRPYTMFYPGLVGLAGALLAGHTMTFDGQLAVAWLAPTLGWIGSHYGGDYFDRRLDAIAKPQRPIPSGRLPARHAVVGFGLCAGGGIVAALLVNWRTALVIVPAVAASIGYSVVFKGRGLSGNLVRGLLTGLAVLFGAMTTVPYPPLSVLPVAVVFVLHDAMSNLVGTLRDIDGDRAAGYNTFAVRHNGRSTASLIRVLAGVTMGTAVVSASLAGLLTTDFFLLFFSALVLVGLALATVGAAGPRMSQRRALRAHALLVVERIVLAGAYGALAAGIVPALIIVLPAVAATALLQAAIRSRHELAHLATGTARAAY